MIILYASILSIIILGFVLKKAIKTKNEHYDKILPIAEEKLIRAINNVEKK